MNKDNYYESLTTYDEKVAFSKDALKIASDLIASIPEREIELTRLSSENESMKCTIEKARRLYSEAKVELSKADGKVKKSLYKSLQILRDRIYIIGDIASSSGERLLTEGRPVAIEEINNIIASVEIIIDLLRENSLWDDSDAMPPLHTFSVNAQLSTADSIADSDEHIQSSLFDNEEPLNCAVFQASASEAISVNEDRQE